MSRKVFLLLIVCVLFLCSFDWPVPDPVVTGVFGEYRQDHFHSGIDIGGNINEVHPVANGEIVFVHRQRPSFSSLPVGLGNYVLVQHDDQVRSLYCHLEDGSIPERMYQISVTSVIGRVGNTGYSLGKHLHLTMFDEKTLAFINPFMELPMLPDSQYPVIKEVFFQKAGTTIPLSNGISVPEGDYSVFVRAVDFRNYFGSTNHFLPNDISIKVDSRPAGHIVFDRVAVEDNEAVVGDDKIKLHELYKDGEMYTDTVHFSDIALSAGNVTVTVRVKDFSGNAVEQSYLITVRKQ